MSELPHVEHDAVVEKMRREIGPELYEEIRELWDEELRLFRGEKVYTDVFSSGSPASA